MSVIEWIGLGFALTVITYFGYLIWVAKQLAKSYDCRTCHGYGWIYLAKFRMIRCPDCKGTRHFPGVNR